MSDHPPEAYDPSALDHLRREPRKHRPPDLQFHDWPCPLRYLPCNIDGQRRWCGVVYPLISRDGRYAAVVDVMFLTVIPGSGTTPFRVVVTDWYG